MNPDENNFSNIKMKIEKLRNFALCGKLIKKLTIKLLITSKNCNH